MNTARIRNLKESLTSVLIVIGGLIAVIAIWANLASSDHCPPEEAAAGICIADHGGAPSNTTTTSTPGATTSTTTGGGTSTSSSTSSTVPATTSTTQRPISAAPSGGGSGISVKTGGNNMPNTASVMFNGCDPSEPTDNGIYIMSGETNTCTATIDKVPSNWMMTVDAADFTFNNVLYTNGVKVFDNLNGSVTITLHNGAAMLGVEAVAKQRFCQISKIGRDLHWGNFAHEWPSLWGDQPCPGLTLTRKAFGSASGGSAGSGSTNKKTVFTKDMPNNIADYQVGDVVDGSSKCDGGKFTLGANGVPNGCTGGTKLDEEPCMVATRPGQVYNGDVNEKSSC